jgi:hypothetical protein
MPDRFGKVKLDSCIKKNGTSFPLEVFWRLDDPSRPPLVPFKSFKISCGTCWSVPYVLYDNDDCTGKQWQDAALQQCTVKSGHSSAAILCEGADEMIV